MGRDFSIGCSNSTCKGVNIFMAIEMMKLEAQLREQTNNNLWSW